ncbi:MAG: TrkH family potassium uptake protein, partial [Spirochaetales bacterium]|nr:TrkH family potassium uptake protein [Spirochaetales bacterium]
HITYLFTLQRLKGHFFSFFLFIILYAPLHSTTIGVAFLLSAIIYLLTRKYRGKKFRTKDGFLMVSLSWIIASAIGAVPFTISGAIPSYTDAFFETMSGFTTTGASILQDIEAMPKSMLMWRALTHWLGGMGIVVLTIAILPLLGVSGISLMKAEAPGPSVEKISPKIANTAKILWVTYLGLTLLEIIALKIAGMSLFDSVVHTFATVATGGFS